MPTRPRRVICHRATKTAIGIVLGGLTLFATACSSDSGSSDADSSTTEASVTTRTVAPGAELQGTWSVDFTLDPTAANDPGDAENVAETFHETWVFTETADGCEPGDAGCLVNRRDDGTSGDAKAVAVDGDGYITDKTVQDDALCDGETPGSIHSIRTFDVDASGRLTGVFHQVITPDDLAACAVFEGTYTFAGSIEEGSSTTTTAP